MNELEKAYERLDMKEYKEIMNSIEDIFYCMRVYDFEDELIIVLDKESKFECIPHLYEGKLFAFNVYTRQKNDLILIDSFDTKEEGENLIKVLQKSIANNEELFFLPY